MAVPQRKWQEILENLLVDYLKVDQEEKKLKLLPIIFGNRELIWKGLPMKTRASCGIRLKIEFCNYMQIQESASFVLKQ